MSAGSPAAPARAPDRRGLKVALLVGIPAMLVIGAVVWLLLSDGEAGPRTERVVTDITMVEPPPPPPPEPEDPIMKEEEIVEPDEAPPSETPPETPSETPSEAPAEAAPVTSAPAGLDRPADAGSDSFSLAAGGGGGLFGRGTGGGGGGEWGAYVQGHIRRALQQDPRTRVARGSLRVSVVIDEDGRFSQPRLLSSTGDDELDAAVREVLQRLPRLGVRRPAGRGARTYATIDMKRT